MANVEPEAARDCRQCGSEVCKKSRQDRAYCSAACRQSGYRRRRRAEAIERQGLAALARLTALCDAAGIASRNADEATSRNANGADDGQR